MKTAFRVTLILILTVIVFTAFAFITTAESDVLDGRYIVNGTGYDDWSSAKAAADGKYTIFLNEDISVSETIAIDSKVKLNLNGHTVNSIQKSTSDYIFTLSSGADLTLEGYGTVSNVAGFVKAEVGTKFTFKGLGTGIVINLKKNADDVFKLASNTESYITGLITATPSGIGGDLFYIGTNKATDNAKLIIDGARFTVNEPSDTTDRTNSGDAINFMIAEDAADIVIKDSLINIVHGDFLELKSTSASLLTATASGISPTSYTGAITDPTVWVDIDDSEIIAGLSSYTRAVHSNNYFGAGILFNVADKATEIRVDNSKLVGTNRTIAGKTARNNAKTTSAFLYFTNVDFTSCDRSLYTSCWLVAEKVNLIWNGGKINFKNFTRTDMGVISALNDYGTANIDPFGNEAAYALGLDSIPDDYVVYHNTTKKTYTYYVFSEAKGDVISGGCVGYSEMKKVSDSSGKITGYTTISAGETPDACFGLLFKNVYFVTAPNASYSSLSGTNSIYSTQGTAYTNVSVTSGYKGKVTVYGKAFLDSPHENDTYDVIDAFTSVYNPTLQYIGSAYSEIESVGQDSEGAISKTVRDFGVHTNVPKENGKNGYFKYFISEGEVDTNELNPYFEMKIGNYATSKLVYTDSENGKTVSADSTASHDFTIDAKNAGYSLQDYKFVVQEFDVSTDSAKYVKISACLITRYALLSYNDSTYTMASASQAQGSFNPGSISESGVMSFKSSSDSISVDTSGDIVLPTDGSWTRIAYVYEILGWGEGYDYELGAHTRQRSAMNLKLHVYVNGAWAASFTNVLTAQIDTELRTTLCLDAMRFNTNCNVGSILIDNPRVSYYSEGDTEALGELSLLMENPKANVNGLKSFNFFPDNNSYYSPFAYVDGEICETEDELISKIKNGSTVELKKPFKNSIIELSKNVTFKTGGIALPLIVSEKYKLTNEYSDIYNLVLADESEIFEIKYLSEEFSINTVAGTAALGTYISPKIEVDGSAQTENGDIYLVGWSLNKDILDLTVSYQALRGDGTLTLYPIYEFAATVVWVDANGDEIARKNYKPYNGAYSEEYVADGIPKIFTGNGWYDLVYTSHKPVLIEAAGVYTVSPDMRAVLPNKDDSCIDRILLNLSLYTDYTLNIYIPTYDLPSLIDSLVISKTENGMDPLSSKEVTVKGDIHTMFSDSYGVADTTINKYYIIYEVGDTRLSQTIEYGVPYYAYTVMNDDTQEMVTEKAKHLVMNMVDYALSVIDYCASGADATIYRNLIANEDFISYITSYDDDALYLEGGAIYEAYTKTLTYRAGAVDNPETEDINESTLESEKMKYASYWIKSAMFYFSTETPTFIIEYSDKAESLFEGIKIPNSDGSYGYWDRGGLFVYLGVESPGERIGPGMHVAYKGTIYNGEMLDPSGDWSSTEYGGLNTYYAIAMNTTTTSNYCTYSIYNMAEPLHIQISNNDGADDDSYDEDRSLSNDFYPGNGIKATYSLSAYIMEMLLLEKEQLNLASQTDDSALQARYLKSASNYRQAAETAKSLYSYAKVARDYMGIESLPNYN